MRKLSRQGGLTAAVIALSQPAPLQYVGTVSSYQFLLWSSSSAAPEPGARMINITADVPSGSPGGQQLNVYLYFVPSGQTPGSPVYAPEQYVSPSVMQSSFTLYTAMDDYWAILDLLRNTSGLTFNVDSNDLNGWTLQTTAPQNAGRGLCAEFESFGNERACDEDRASGHPGMGPEVCWEDAWEILGGNRAPRPHRDLRRRLQPATLARSASNASADPATVGHRG